MRTVFRFFSSLKLAVFVILGLAVALAIGTILESAYDIKTGRYWVYQARWFYGLLILLGINIFAVALSRLPWKRKHIPFLLAHLGILLLLFGSWVTFRYGVDGSLVVSEGEESPLVQLDQPVLYIESTSSNSNTPFEKHIIPWIPPGREFSPIRLSKWGLKVEEFIPHAQPEVRFESDQKKTSASAPALKLLLKGGPMDFHEVFWLWAGDPGWRAINLGPARFVLHPKGEKSLEERGSLLEFFIQDDSTLSYKAVSSQKKIKKGILKKPVSKKIIDTGWMAKTGRELKVHVLEWIPNALNRTRYVPSRIQYGNQAPASAIRVRPYWDSKEVDFWMGMGDRVSFRVPPEKGGGFLNLSYLEDRLVLPFAIRLQRFEIQNYQGSRNPAFYSSQVNVLAPGAPTSPVTISMNEPLEWNGYTLYQSSYIPGSPRPTTSVFTVNRDPGRWLKYAGSLLIVLGAVLLFAVKYWKNVLFFDFLRGKK